MTVTFPTGEAKNEGAKNDTVTLGELSLSPSVSIVNLFPIPPNMLD
jgi:hypothetical protein